MGKLNRVRLHRIIMPYIGLGHVDMVLAALDRVALR